MSVEMQYINNINMLNWKTPNILTKKVKIVFFNPNWPLCKYHAFEQNNKKLKNHLSNMRDLKLPGGSILENENDRHKNCINYEENCNYAIKTSKAK